MDESEEYPKGHYDGQRVTSMSSSPTTSVLVTALDGLVNVNSLFTISVFMGLSLTVPGEQCLENCTCVAGTEVVRLLLVFEFVSFSCFLFSSLIAQGLKLALNLINCEDATATEANIHIRVLRWGMLASALGSVMGCLFLMLSILNVIRIRLGMVLCSNSAFYSALALFVLVPIALVFYIGIAICAYFMVRCLTPGPASRVQMPCSGTGPESSEPLPPGPALRGKRPCSEIGPESSEPLPPGPALRVKRPCSEIGPESSEPLLRT